MPKRDAIFPADRQALYDMHRYSAAIRSGDLLFVSGQVGGREDGSPEPDFAKQVQLAFDNLAAVLAVAGCSFDDVVDVTTFHTDPASQFDTVMAVRSRMIGEPPYPNWTAVGVTWLAGFDFEVKAIARIPSNADPFDVASGARALAIETAVRALIDQAGAADPALRDRIAATIDAYLTTLAPASELERAFAEQARSFAASLLGPPPNQP